VCCSYSRDYTNLLPAGSPWVLHEVRGVVGLVGMRVESGVDSGVDSGLIVGSYYSTLGLVPWLVVHC
jgi:hypothetical protein